MLKAGLLLLALTATAAADEVTLHNGSTFVGAVREEGDRVSVEMDYGTMTFKKVDVKAIRRGEDTVRGFEERVARANRATELVEAALWGREKGLTRRADDLLQRVIRVDPDQPEARKALGHERVDGQWLHGDALLTARGLQQVDGKWVPKADAQRLLDRREAARAAVERNTLDRRVADQKHEEEMQRLALEAERLELERQGAARVAIEQEQLRSRLDRNRWYGASRLDLQPLWCETPAAPPSPPPAQTVTPPAVHGPPSRPQREPSVLPISPPWQRPALHSSQPRSEYEKRDEEERERAKRR
ncbi:MAG: hypothetical protein JO332_08005 [Planctomycetaceae bacterium]|nr:hypothetical protein [Planctomycetaceae bacterium]